MPEPVTEPAWKARIILPQLRVLEGSMGQQASRLPTRFPVGTRYVIEGRGGLISLRYLEFPDGRKVDLPSDLAARTRSRPRTRVPRVSPQKPGLKKMLNPVGTKPGMPG
jgi:hypothetical protein